MFLKGCNPENRMLGVVGRENAYPVLRSGNTNDIKQTLDNFWPRLSHLYDNRFAIGDLFFQINLESGS